MMKRILLKGYGFSSHFIPVKNNVIMFESSNGRNYTGNPRYIYEEMVKQGLDKKYKCVWSLTDTD
ncbi:MAG: CDP-glycerol glycerophosphotransferase family protein, partial [Bacteroidaceae bacterium]|nr:CDP-glycerol glycerophosphotransferase family protein [Bacteroidaceae bacterium]